MIRFSLFTQSLLHHKIFDTLKLYQVLFVVKKFLNRQKMTDK